MRSMKTLFRQLERDFPELKFEQSDNFWWSARERVIHIDQSHQHSELFSLHELSHALLDHSGYRYDIDLIKLERDAWDYAKHTLAPKYGVAMDEQVVQDNLDTYRDWLHARSSCPECESTGLQTKEQLYRCLDCGHRWRTNEARVCALRRYSLATK